MRGCLRVGPAGGLAVSFDHFPSRINAGAFLESRSIRQGPGLQSALAGRVDATVVLRAPQGGTLATIVLGADGPSPGRMCGPEGANAFGSLVVPGEEEIPVQARISGGEVVLDTLAPSRAGE